VDCGAVVFTTPTTKERTGHAMLKASCARSARSVSKQNKSWVRSGMLVHLSFTSLVLIQTPKTPYVQEAASKTATKGIRFKSKIRKQGHPPETKRCLVKNNPSQPQYLTCGKGLYRLCAFAPSSVDFEPGNPSFRACNFTRSIKCPTGNEGCCSFLTSCTRSSSSYACRA
jgi:hypothetical protein